MGRVAVTRGDRLPSDTPEPGALAADPAATGTFRAPVLTAPRSWQLLLLGRVGQPRFALARRLARPREIGLSGETPPSYPRLGDGRLADGFGLLWRHPDDGLVEMDVSSGAVEGGVP